MSDIPKVTKEMVEGKQKIPAGYELKKVHHDEYSYTHSASGKKVVVKAHDEHFLKEIKKEAKKSAGGANSKPAVDSKHVNKKAAKETGKGKK